MKQSYLINDRIYLRAVEPEDIDVMYEMENDPSMWDISSFTVPYSRYVLRQYIEGSQSDMFADKQLRLMIIRREDNRTIGTIDITDFVPLHSRGAVGIALHADYAFDFLQIHQLYAHVATENEASMKLFASCGFAQCGLLKDWLSTSEGYKDAALMQRIKITLNESGK